MTKGLSTKISGKYDAGGFVFDKLEIDNAGRVSAETSLKQIDNLKVEFKGNDKDKGDLSVTYYLPAATLTADIDCLSFKKASTSVLGVQGPFSLGGSADICLTKFSVNSSTVGVSYAKDDVTVGVSTTNFADYAASLLYSLKKDVTIGAQAKIPAKDAFKFGLVGAYRCNPNTTIKLKAGSCGTINASVKQNIDNFSVVSSVEVPAGFSNMKFGINAVLN